MTELCSPGEARLCGSSTPSVRGCAHLVESTFATAFLDRTVNRSRVRQPDITLARTALGGEPRIPIEDGLKQTIAWFREHPDSAGDGVRGEHANEWPGVVRPMLDWEVGQAT